MAAPAAPEPAPGPSILPAPEEDDELPIIRRSIDPAAPPTDDKGAEPTAVSRIIYVCLTMVPIVLGGIVILVRTGIIARPGSAGKTPWDLSIICVSIVTALIMAAVAAKRSPESLRRARGPGSDRTYAAWEFGAVCVTAPLAVALAFLAFAAWAQWVPLPGAMATDPMVPPVIAALAVLVSTGPVAYFSLVRARHDRAVEERFPDLLRDLNESYAAGMTMAQSIRVASRGDYGRLNPEIRRMAHQLSWGTTFPDALRLFSERVGTPLVTRAVSLIIKATQAGGNVKDVLAAAARDSREIKALEADRRLSMALYVIVIYVAFGVFLGVTAALQGLLIPSVLGSTGQISGSGVAALNVQSGLTMVDFQFVFFGVGIIQALGSGIVAGVMSEGNIAAGLKHSAIMVAITALVLGVLL